MPVRVAHDTVSLSKEDAAADKMYEHYRRLNFWRSKHRLGGVYILGERNLGLKETRMEPAKLFVAVCAIVLGEWVMTACASTALDTACPSAATDIQSVEFEHHTANKRNPCLTQCVRCPPEVRSATSFLVLRRFPPRPVFSRVPTANRAGSTTDHRLDR